MPMGCMLSLSVYTRITNSGANNAKPEKSAATVSIEVMVMP